MHSIQVTCQSSWMCLSFDISRPLSMGEIGHSHFLKPDYILGRFSFQVLFAIKSLHLVDQIRAAVCPQPFSELLSSPRTHTGEHRWVSNRQKGFLSFHLRALFFGGRRGTTFWSPSPNSFPHRRFTPGHACSVGASGSITLPPFPDQCFENFPSFPDSGACRHSDLDLLL